MVFGELRTKSMVTTVIERSLQTHSNNLKMPSAYSEVMDSSACTSPITSAFERRSRSEMEFSERMSGLWAPISDGDHLGMPFGLVVDDLEPFSRASQTVDYAYPDFGPGVEVEEDEMGRAIYPYRPKPRMSLAACAAAIGCSAREADFLQAMLHTCEGDRRSAYELPGAENPPPP